MAGTTPLSLVQQFDFSGQPLAGGLLYFYAAGTVSTPQTAYADFGLTVALPNPLTLDQSGRVPQHWLADGLIHIRLTDSSGGGGGAGGLPIIDTTMQVLGPSSGGGGGGGTVDPTALAGTGDIKSRYGTGPISGWVRCNGLTIGSAVSGATERANADTTVLWVYLYQSDPNLVVSGGRSGNALNDFNANKTIALPDLRGRVIGGLADMGNSATTALTATYFGASVTVLGSAGGVQASIMSVAQMPAHTHANTVSLSDPGHAHADSLNDPGHTHANTLTDPGHFHQYPANNVDNSPAAVGALAPIGAGAGAFNSTTNVTGITINNASHVTGMSINNTSAGTGITIGINNVSVGTSAPFPTVTPTMLMTIYLKL